jgi:cyclase
MRPRIIPVLLIDNGGLSKTVNFKKSVYVGDPINAIRLFNDMEVDEIIVLDISASKEKRGPDFILIREIASEAFMPFTYGGGITSVEEARQLFRVGVEKIAINHSALTDMSLIAECAVFFGTQSVVGAVDVKTNFLKQHKIYNHSNGKTLKVKLEDYLSDLINAGAGEIFLNSVDRDGLMNGFDHELLKLTRNIVPVPLIFCGGAGDIKDMKEIISLGADAAAAGSLFVFKGKQKGVLINYPSQPQLDELFQ